ncbi:hypothetical protein BJX96DRAFT_561 [Aspergillus floccosus]
MRTSYLWALSWGICVIGAEHHTQMRSTLKRELKIEAREVDQSVLGLEDERCYICSPPCSHAVCCHGRFPQCCSDGAYCYCCED